MNIQPNIPKREDYCLALDWLRDTLASHNLSHATPDALEFGDNHKVKLGRGNEKGSPAYWARVYRNGSISITFRTFRHGGAEAKYYTGDDRGKPFDQTKYIVPDMTAVCQASKKEEDDKAKKRRESLEFHRGVYNAAKDATAKNFPEDNYFRRKGVEVYAEHIQGLRFNPRGAAYYPLLDRNWDIVGFKVFDPKSDVQKRTVGSVKGSFSLIGTIKEDTTVILIAESVATALSGYAAFGGKFPAVIADHVNNLPLVTKLFREKYPNAGIVILADNDQWKDPDRNPGIEWANKAKQGLREVYVVYPEGLSSPDTDFNDLHAAFGLDEVHNQIVNQLEEDAEETAPSDEPGTTSRSDTNSTVLESIQRSASVGSIIVRACERFVSYVVKAGINCITSAKGTGKTTLLKGVVHHQYNEWEDATRDPDKKVLYISFLRALTATAAEQFNLVNYLDLEGEDSKGRLCEQPRLAICVNSLMKLLDGNKLPKYDVVIIDESESTLRSIARNMPYRDSIYPILKDLVLGANTVVMADANLGSLTHRFLDELGGKRQIHQYINTYRPGKGRKATFYDNESQLITDIETALSEEKRVFVNTNNRRKAEELQTYLMGVETLGLDQNTCKLITGQNAGEEWAKSFFRNPNEAVKGVRLFITTPAVSTGVSIDAIDDAPVFDITCGFFYSGITPVEDNMQGMARAREVKDHRVFVQPTSGRFPRTKEEIMHQIDLGKLELESEGIILRYQSGEGLKAVNTLNTDLTILRIVKDDNGMYMLKEKMVEAYKEEEYHVEFNKEGDGQVSKRVIQAREETKEKRIHAILNAAEIDENKAKELDMKVTTQDESYSLIAYTCRKFYGQLTEEVLNNYQNGRGMGYTMGAFNTATNEETIAMKLAKQGDRFETDINLPSLRRVYFRMVLHAVQGEFGKDSEQIHQFLRIVDSNRKLLKAIIRNIPSWEKLQEKPIYFIREQVQAIGLKLRVVSRKKSGYRTYALDKEQNAFQVRTLTHQSKVQELNYDAGQVLQSFIDGHSAANVVEAFEKESMKPFATEPGLSHLDPGNKKVQEMVEERKRIREIGGQVCPVGDSVLF